MHAWSEIADGVFVGRYEFFDQTIGLVVGDGGCLVLDTRTTYAQADELLEDIRRITPHPPTVLNTHHHFDHSGGLRTYVAEGATIITHQGNREFYDQVVFHPSVRTMQSDRLSLAPRAPAFETTNQKYVVSDGVRSLEVYTVQGLGHSQGMLIAYLPKEKLLVNADLYSPPAQGAQPPATPTAGSVVLNQNIQRLKLDVVQHVPIHGQPGSAQQFAQIVGRGTN